MEMIKPVFIKLRDVPDSEENKPTVLELCRAAESVTGQGSILGAQIIRGLWRIYPATKDARNDLLIRRLVVRNTCIPVSDSNPYIIRADTGEEKLTTKVWIDDVPMSVADSEIEHSLVKIGCELRSKIIADRARDADNKLTRFLTGRRYVFISIPPTPLEKTLKVNIFTARIFHREQKVSKTVICSNCLETDHHRSVCDKEVVCRACKLSGHKQGDEQCNLARADEQASRRHAENTIRGSNSHRPERQENKSQRMDKTANTSASKTPDKQRKAEKGRSKENDSRPTSRGRPFSRQTTLRSTMELDQHPRNRSETPKRRRSHEQQSPRESTEKQARRDDNWKTDEGESDIEPADTWK